MIGYMGLTENGQAPLPPLAPGHVRVRTLYTALSRGTESLVAAGRVPESEHQRMRAPFMGGAFPFPVKYGYANVGRVEAGPAGLVGKDVFSLSPHQTLIDLPEAMAVPLPAGVPASRAVLSANMETALNALWDAEPKDGAKIAVVGADRGQGAFRNGEAGRFGSWRQRLGRFLNPGRTGQPLAGVGNHRAHRFQPLAPEQVVEVVARGRWQGDPDPAASSVMAGGGAEGGLEAGARGVVIGQDDDPSDLSRGIEALEVAGRQRRPHRHLGEGQQGTERGLEALGDQQHRARAQRDQVHDPAGHGPQHHARLGQLGFARAVALQIGPVEPQLLARRVADDGDQRGIAGRAVS